MDIERAKEIVQTERMIPVLYKGDSIWIEHLDEENGTARVHKSDEPEQGMIVDIEQLEG